MPARPVRMTTRRFCTSRRHRCTVSCRPRKCSGNGGRLRNRESKVGPPSSTTPAYGGRVNASSLRVAPRTGGAPGGALTVAAAAAAAAATSFTSAVGSPGSMLVRLPARAARCGGVAVTPSTTPLVASSSRAGVAGAGVGGSNSTTALPSAPYATPPASSMNFSHSRDVVASWLCDSARRPTSNASGTVCRLYSAR